MGCYLEFCALPKLGCISRLGNFTIISSNKLSTPLSLCNLKAILLDIVPYHRFPLSYCSFFFFFFFSALIHWVLLPGSAGCWSILLHHPVFCWTSLVYFSGQLLYFSYCALYLVLSYILSLFVEVISPCGHPFLLSSVQHLYSNSC